MQLLLANVPTESGRRRAMWSVLELSHLALVLLPLFVFCRNVFQLVSHPYTWSFIVISGAPTGLRSAVRAKQCEQMQMREITLPLFSLPPSSFCSHPTEAEWLV